MFLLMLFTLNLTLGEFCFTCDFTVCVMLHDYHFSYQCAVVCLVLNGFQLVLCFACLIVYADKLVTFCWNVYILFCACCLLL